MFSKDSKEEETTKQTEETKHSPFDKNKYLYSG